MPPAPMDQIPAEPSVFPFSVTFPVTPRVFGEPVTSEMSELIVSTLELLFAIPVALFPIVIVPLLTLVPSVNAPDCDPTVMFKILTVPFTPIVPVASPFPTVDVPKKTLSAVPVVRVPLVAVPTLLVLQSASVPQTPPAVPNPDALMGVVLSQ